MKKNARQQKHPGQYMKTRMISDNHPDGQDAGPGPARPTWAWAHLGHGPLGPGPTWALAHLGPGPLGPGPLGQDDGQDDEVCIPRMIDRMMGKVHISIYFYFGHFILVYRMIAYRPG